MLASAQLITGRLIVQRTEAKARCRQLGFARWLAAEPNTGSQGALTIILSAIDGRFPEKPFWSLVRHLKRPLGDLINFPDNSLF